MLPAPPPPPAPLPQSTCRDGNLEEWAGFAAIVQVAKAQRAKGDPYHFATATEWLGSMLMACFPDRFKVTASPEPPASSGAGQPAPAPAPPAPGPPADPKP